MSYIIQYSVAMNKGTPLESVRLQHRAHVESWDEKVQFTGLTLAEDGTTLLGAIFVLRVEDRSHALRFSSDDPYVQAGIFEAPQVARFMKRRGWND